VPGAPQVVALNAPRYRESLYALSNSQLSADDAARLKCSGETPIEVAKGEISLPANRAGPGNEWELLRSSCLRCTRSRPCFD